MNDYDRIADEIGVMIAILIENCHAPGIVETDSITLTKDGFICTVIGLQRLRGWVEGLARTHRETELCEVDSTDISTAKMEAQ